MTARQPLLGSPLHVPAVPLMPWQASLNLRFAQRGAGTILAGNRHEGPLRIQKALYPEGLEVCHAIVLHPPSGVAGGDQLDIGLNLEAGAHALLTTPGAGKWYRSAGPEAAQRLNFRVADGAVLEWLPQENIVFDGARAAQSARVALAGSARFLGWDILCLGRRASGERFQRGSLGLETRLLRDGQTIWLERGRLAGGSPLLDSPAGLVGCSVTGTLLAAGAPVPSALLAACRAVSCTETGARTGVTVLPAVLAARYLGHSAEAARAWFTELWRLLRPAFAGREAAPPRIWNT